MPPARARRSPERARKTSARSSTSRCGLYRSDLAATAAIASPFEQEINLKLKFSYAGRIGRLIRKSKNECKSRSQREHMFAKRHRQACPCTNHARRRWAVGRSADSQL